MARTSTALFALAITSALLSPAAASAQANDLGAPAPVERDVTISVVAPTADVVDEDSGAPAAEAEPEPVVDTVFEAPSATDVAVPTAPAEARSSSAGLSAPNGYGAYGTTADGTPIGAMAAAAPAGVADSRRRPGRAIEVDDEDTSRLPRISVMTLAGGATMVAAGFGMYEVGCALGGGRTDSGSSTGGTACFATGIPVAIVSALSLTPLSVWLSGKAMDGNGGYGWTLLGTGAGTVAGTLGGLFAAVSGATQDEALIPMMIGPVLGAVIAYELSSDASRSAVEEAERRAQSSFSASVAPTDGGGMVAVFGTF